MNSRPTEMQKAFLSGRSIAPASAPRQARGRLANGVVRATASSSSSSPDPSSSSPTTPQPQLSSSRRDALALGAASLALGLGSGLISTPAARADEGGEWNRFELGGRRKKEFIECRSKRETAATKKRRSTKKPNQKEAEYSILYGTASPPTSYGGYGGNAQETAK